MNQCVYEFEDVQAQKPTLLNVYFRGAEWGCESSTFTFSLHLPNISFFYSLQNFLIKISSTGIRMKRE